MINLLSIHLNLLSCCLHIIQGNIPSSFILIFLLSSWWNFTSSLLLHLFIVMCIYLCCNICTKLIFLLHLVFDSPIFFDLSLNFLFFKWFTVKWEPSEHLIQCFIYIFVIPIWTFHQYRLISTYFQKFTSWRVSI